MTIRLGVGTGAGHGALIRQRFGLGRAMLSAGTLFASGIVALKCGSRSFLQTWPPALALVPAACSSLTAAVSLAGAS